MRWLFYLLLFIAIERFCYFQTGTFSLHKMVSTSAPPSPYDDRSPLTLAQPLRFIGAGNQFYVFETADQQYVVKFLKWSRRRPNLLLQFLPSHVAARTQKAAFLLESCRLALEHLRQETHLVTVKPPRTLTLIDKLGITHTLSTNTAHFYVQKKAAPLTTHYRRAHLQPFIDAVISQCAHGIQNLDPVVERNYGIIDGQIALLDIGSFKTTSPPLHRAQLHYAVVLELIPLRAFLQRRHPEDLAYFDELLIAKLSSATL